MFRPIKSQKITDNLYAIRSTFVNFYVFDTGKSLISFDTGMASGLAKRGFKKLDIDYNKVTSVFLTHSDFDHAGGLNLFKNANIYLSNEEEPLITHEKTRRAVMYNRKIKNYKLLNDLDIVNIDGAEIKILSSPGHTIGSAIYIINNSIMIAGDTISISGKGEIRNFGFIQNMSHSTNIKTVERFKQEKIFEKMLIIATGHYGIKKSNE